MNPYDDLHRTKLAKAIESSYRGLEWMRNLKRGLVESYAGSGYGKSRTNKRETIVNLAMQTVDAYTMALVANRPRVLITSKRQEQTYFAKHFTAAINSYIEEIGLEFTLRNWVLDAFFGLGVIKLHLADSGMVQLELDRYTDPGKPFASNISNDNYVFDMQAPRQESVRFAGDSYRIAFSDLEHPMFDPQAVRDMIASKNSSDDERLERLSRSDSSNEDEFEPMFDLADIWIPKDGKIYTFPLDSRGQFQIKGAPVAVMDWDGSERGPYQHLSFQDVPDNVVPTSMLASLAAQDRLINNVLRKQAKKAMSQKDVLAYTPSGADDAKRIQRTDDGGMCQVQDVTQIQPMKMNGIDAANQAFAVGMMQLYDRAAGNLTGMLGLGSQAPTASQEQIIQGRISSKGASMQYRVLDATSRLIRGLAYMLWNDRAKSMQMQIPVEGSDGYSLPAQWTPDDRVGRFSDYDVQVDVFSMAYQSPEERWAKVSAFINQQYLPFVPVYQAQGIQLDLNAYVDMAAEFMNVPQLKECLKSATPMDMPAEESPGPSNTTRSYERRSVSAGPTAQNAAQQQMEQWMNMDSAATGGMRGNAA